MRIDKRYVENKNKIIGLAQNDSSTWSSAEIFEEFWKGGRGGKHTY